MVRLRVAGGHATNRRLIGYDTVVGSGQDDSGRCLGFDVTERPGMLAVVHIVRERVIFGDGQHKATSALVPATACLCCRIGVVTLDGIDYCLRGRKKRNNDLITSSIYPYLWSVSPNASFGKEGHQASSVSGLVRAGLDMIRAVYYLGPVRINQIVIPFRALSRQTELIWKISVSVSPGL